MASFAVEDRDPRLVAAGRRGAEKRWGPRRIVRMADLSPEQRRLVLSLVDAARAANERGAVA